MLLAGLLVWTSCLSSDDEDYTYHDDTAITSFTLGTLNRVMHTTSASGADSTYRAKVTGSVYKFYIDQLRAEIYNPDSLPQGTDAAHVLVTLGTKNSGVVALKSMTSDSLSSFSSSDSIDFSQPRVFRVYSNSGTTYRDYTVRVNVHQQDGDAFSWSLQSTQANVANYRHMKAFGIGTSIYLFGGYEGGTELSVFASDGTASVSNALLSADTWKNVAVKGEKIYLLDNGSLQRIDGSRWERVGNGSSLAQLIGASSSRLYGLTNEGQIVSSDDEGQTWTIEPIDSDIALLPTEDISCVCLPLATNSDAERVVMVGNRSLDNYPDDAYAAIWGKIDELNATRTHQWMYYTPDSKNNHLLPRMSGLAVTAQNGNLLAIGGKGVGASDVTAFSHLYESVDGGISWYSTQYSLPDDLNVEDVAALATDSNNNIWLFCGKSGQVWRGRLNKWGWEQQQTIFQE